MTKAFEHLAESGLSGWQDTTALIGRLFDTARPAGVFSEPLQAGDHTIITASEVMVGMGAGYGSGSGFGPDEAEKGAVEETAGNKGGIEAVDHESGGGGGGGGYATGRPVAIISVGPEGVAVQPVPDVTKVLLALTTMLGTLLVLVSKMRQAGRE